jgi:hypothetical protein
MITIPIVCAGDHWLNPEEVKTAIENADSDDTILLDLRAEGPSLHALGVVDLVRHFCGLRGIDLEDVWVDGWSNTVEQIPFKSTRTRITYDPLHWVSHFFWYSDRYRPRDIIEYHDDKTFGFFMGRPCLPRLCMLRDLSDRDDVLLSVMLGASTVPGYGVDVYQSDFWNHHYPGIDQWFRAQEFTSLDGSSVQDQYDPGKNTNQSILAFYGKFAIEIVAESYIYGDSFFPTEKTVRPLLAGRPMLIMGPRKYLSQLRELGFRTWGDLWDETYDDHQGLERWQKLLSVIDGIPENFRKIQQSLREISRHNRERAIYLADRYRPCP